ncbi:MAG TPA: thiamine pyrophosphate-dependent dehydrogenase E1 component subunit alpha [Pyrinomonadaceae bacterium]|nr:thiamine pyrophosphate-dependent dehydrogenase E1 component subunit alpha [Pyrinomonadaceae bacterium]
MDVFLTLMDQQATVDREKRRRRLKRPRFQMRVSTKFAPRKPADGEPLTCTSETTLKPEQLLEIYRYLKLTRLVEERLVNLYRQTKVVGGVFRSLGQEATAVGTAYALQPHDFITPLIRDLGAVLVKGIRPREIFAQYMAKAWGPSGGRDLNIHFGDMQKGFIGPISHLGDMIPVMTGILLGARMQKKKFVGVAYIGDGGMSTGAFHEGLNFAAVQRLPLLVVAEHNHYAYSTPTSLQTAVKDLAEKAAGYGIPAYIVDGNDVIACYEVTKAAADYARRGGGAVLIEAKTYRRKGHAEHDDQRYITPGEIEWWEKNNDPVDRFEKYLLQTGVTQPQLDAITADVIREIDEDTAWAESSPMPDPEQAAYNVFDNTIVPPAFRPKVLEEF